MSKELIDGIYNSALLLVLENVEPDKIEIIKEAYKGYLIDSYDGTLEPNDDLNQVINVYTDLEKKRWKNKTTNEKLSRIIKDENLNQIIQLSHLGYQYALKKRGCIIANTKYQPELTQEQAKEYIDNMVSLKEGVQPYNSVQADKYISEGILDFEYSSNLSEYMSLRIGRMK